MLHLCAFILDPQAYVRSCMYASSTCTDVGLLHRRHTHLTQPPPQGLESAGTAALLPPTPAQVQPKQRARRRMSSSAAAAGTTSAAGADGVQQEEAEEQDWDGQLGPRPVVGRLLRMKLVDFMCHHNLEVEFG